MRCIELLRASRWLLPQPSPGATAAPPSAVAELGVVSRCSRPRRTQLNQITIRRAESAEDFEELCRFRYRIYVEEMQRTQRYADHDRKRIEEPLDATAAHFLAFAGDEIIGCIRWNSGLDTDFGEYADLYAMHLAGPFFPNRCAISTKLMVIPSYRRSTVPLSLCVECYSFGVARGTAFDFMDCNPHLERMFAHYGYRSYRGRIQHPEYGDVLPMVLVVLDHDHLQAVASPFAPVAARYPHEPEAVRHFHEHVSNHPLINNNGTH